MRWLGALALFCSVAACECGSGVDDLTFHCANDDECVGGFQCIGSVCAKGSGDGGPSDAGMPDGGPIDSGVPDAGAPVCTACWPYACIGDGGCHGACMTSAECAPEIHCTSPRCVPKVWALTESFDAGYLYAGTFGLDTGSGTSVSVSNNELTLVPFQMPTVGESAYQPQAMPTWPAVEPPPVLFPSVALLLLIFFRLIPAG